MQAVLSHTRPTPATPAPCGWFDSSQELRQGLVVHELSDLELLALWTELKPAPAALH